MSARTLTLASAVMLCDCVYVFLPHLRWDGVCKSWQESCVLRGDRYANVPGVMGEKNEGRSQDRPELRPSGFLKRVGSGQLAGRNTDKACFIFPAVLSHPQVSGTSQGSCISPTDPGVGACGVSRVGSAKRLSGSENRVGWPFWAPAKPAFQPFPATRALLLGNG